jgi:hypothetical protein
MKSLILYGSPTKLTNSHKLVTRTNSGFAPQPPYYVRAHLVPVGIDQALVKAGQGMMEGETVLNTVPIE